MPLPHRLQEYLVQFLRILDRSRLPIEELEHEAVGAVQRHEGAAPLAAHDEALHHELADGLPDGGAAHVELGGQFVFTQQLAADGVDPVFDALPEYPRDLVVERERLRVVNHERTLS